MKLKFDDLFKGDLNNSMVTNSWLHLTDVMPAEFGWDLPVYYLEYCAKRELGYPLDYLSFELTNAEKIVDINFYIESLNEFLRKKIVQASLLLSLTENSKGNESNGETDMLFWQALGTAKLVIDVKGDRKITKNLEQGDMAYVPAGYKYEILPVTARTTVAFYLEKEKPNEDSSNSTS